MEVREHTLSAAGIQSITAKKSIVKLRDYQEESFSFSNADAEDNARDNRTGIIIGRFSFSDNRVVLTKPELTIDVRTPIRVLYDVYDNFYSDEKPADSIIGRFTEDLTQLQGKFLFRSDNLFFYNVPVDLINGIETALSYWEMDPVIETYDRVRSKSHHLGVFDLKEHKWIVKPEYYYVTKYNDKIIAFAYELKNQEADINALLSNPVYSVFDLKGKLLVRGSLEEAEKILGKKITEVYLIPFK